MEISESAVELGLPVFPCGPDKKPLVREGFHSAKRDPQEIKSLWRLRWGPFIGVPTGLDAGFSVIDFDPQGLAWLAAKTAKRRFPATRVHRTPRGGFHFLYRTPDPPVRNSASKLAWGVDIRGEGGYVIFPPSPGYEVIDESPIATFPRWVLSALQKIETKIQSSYEVSNTSDTAALERFVVQSRPGERNNRLFWAARKAGEAGLGLSVERRFVSAAESIGLPRDEAEATVRSGIAIGERNAGKAR